MINDMKELQKLEFWRDVLHEVVKEYPHRTLENVIQNVEKVIEVKKKNQNR